MNTQPNTGKTPNRFTILRRRAVGIIGVVALAAVSGNIAQGIASGASTDKLIDQVDKKTSTVMGEYTKGQIDTGAVKVIETGDKPVLAWDEAGKVESSQDNVQPLADIIHDQVGGDNVGPHTALVLPKALIKSSVQQVK
jgi:hypothetical protein